MNVPNVPPGFNPNFPNFQMQIHQMGQQMHQMHVTEQHMRHHIDSLKQELYLANGELHGHREAAKHRDELFDHKDPPAPPTFPHLHAGIVADHLILTSLTKGWQDDQAPPAELQKRRAAHMDKMTQPHLGVSLSPTDISFKPSVPGSVQDVEVTPSSPPLATCQLPSSPHVP